jgi:hypothetical protein
MFLSAGSVLVVAQPSSEILEGLMNCPVHVDMVTEGVITLNCRFTKKEGMAVSLTVQPKYRLGENTKIGHNHYFTCPDMSTLNKSSGIPSL